MFSLPSSHRAISGSLEMRGTLIERAGTEVLGGAVTLITASLKAVNCTFRHLKSGFYGGAITATERG
jgi:formylmethanofuran dehydrogenase subunit C